MPEDDQGLPQPIVDPDSQAFWRGLSEGELRLCRCTDCRQWAHPPLEVCRHCGAQTRFEPSSGTGVLFSFITVEQPPLASMVPYLPYAIGVMELDDQPGLRITARVDGVAVDQISIGQRIRAHVAVVPGSVQPLVLLRVDN